MNIMILSNSSYAGYGYSTVTKYVAKGLRDVGHKVVVVGMQTLGKPIKDELGNVNIPICFDAWCGDFLHHYLRAYKTQILITILDVWLEQTRFIQNAVNLNRCKWLCHVTINTDPISNFLVEKIINADRIIAPSIFNYNMLSHVGLSLIHI